MHVIFDGPNQHLKIYDSAGNQTFTCEARNAALNSPSYGHYGSCPPGDYELAAPKSNDPRQPSTDWNNWIGEGLWFVPLIDINQLWNGRDGIGIHGGGTCIYDQGHDPLAAKQGWCKTHGCIRLQNEDLASLVGFLRGKTPVAMSVVQ